MDNNNNGIIDQNEFMKYVQTLDGFDEIEKDLTEESFTKIWKQVDIENKGQVSFHEFLPLCLDMKKLCTEAKITELFAIFDEDGDGEVEIEEFRHIIVG